MRGMFWLQNGAFLGKIGIETFSNENFGIENFEREIAGSLFHISKQLQI